MLISPRGNMHVAGYQEARECLKMWLLEFESDRQADLQDAKMPEAMKMAAVGAIDFCKDAMAQLQL